MERMNAGWKGWGSVHYLDPLWTVIIMEGGRRISYHWSEKMVLLAGSATLKSSMYFSKQGSRKKFLVTHSNVEDVSCSY